MPRVSRRTLLVGAAALPVSGLLDRYAVAQTPHVRYDVMSPKGQAMLAIYADAVKIMKTKGDGDPRSWVFQWYTHSVRTDTTKEKAIAALPAAQRALATEMWNTCQGHRSTVDRNGDFFLPWHRMYVYYLEEMVRALTGKPEFTLPYWNYSSTKTSGPVMPPNFRTPASASNSLYDPYRIPAVNAGGPIGTFGPTEADSLNLLALKETAYEPSGALQGFNMALDQGLHGNVHGGIGAGNNMGAVPWAARDPIFWMHHCNIDRLWASWNHAGRKNPTDLTFLAKTFVFADGKGTRVVGTIQDFLDIASLGYSYDRLEPVHSSGLLSTHLANPAVKVGSVSAGKIHLGAQAIKVHLTTPTAQPRMLTNAFTAAGTGKRLYLVVRNLTADAAPNTLYQLSLELPAGQSANKVTRYAVGVVNFFDAVSMPGMAGMEGMGNTATSSKFYSFDITDLAHNLQTQGHLSAQPTLTIAPLGKPNANANAAIGEITLVQQ